VAAQAWSATQEVARAAGLPEGAPAADARPAGAMGGILECAQLSWAAAGGDGAYAAAAALQRLPWAALLPRLSGAACFASSAMLALKYSASFLRMSDEARLEKRRCILWVVGLVWAPDAVIKQWTSVHWFLRVLGFAGAV